MTNVAMKLLKSEYFIWVGIYSRGSLLSAALEASVGFLVTLYVFLRRFGCDSTLYKVKRQIITECGKSETKKN